MNRNVMLVGKAAGRGAFKGAALVGAFVIIVAAWWWNASLLTAAADENLQLIKTVTGVLPFDWGSKVESALRLFGADRALLLIEGEGPTGLISKRRGRRRGAQETGH